MIRLSRKQRFLLSTLSGLLMVVCYPFTGSLSILAFISWIPLLWVEDYISRNNYRGKKVFLHSYWSFLIFNIGTTWWIWYASIPGALMAFIFNTLLMALTFWLYYFVKKNNGIVKSSMLLITFWLGFEYVHLNWELSHPWINLGNIFSIHPKWIQWYSFTGMEGGTVWVLFANLIGYSVLSKIAFSKSKLKKERLRISLFLGIIMLPIAISYFQYTTYVEKVDPIEIVVVQPNIDPYNEKFDASLKDQLNKLFNLADEKVSPKTSLVLAPETALSYAFYEEEIRNYPFFKYLIERKNKWGNIDFYIGASTLHFYPEKHSYASREIHGGPGYYESYNTSLHVDKANKEHFIHKSKLVLGVEKIPFMRYLPWLDKLAINLDGASGSLGIETEPKIFESDSYKFSPCVCYESIYGEFMGQQSVKGGEFISIITNDGWWRDTPGHRQHASYAQLRAIENRRSIARSANTGISCFINQKGDLLESSGWWEAAVLNGTINKNKEITFYSKHGDYLARFLGLLALILTLFTSFQWVKSKFGIGNENDKSV